MINQSVPFYSAINNADDDGNYDDADEDDEIDEDVEKQKKLVPRLRSVYCNELKTILIFYVNALSFGLTISYTSPALDSLKEHGELSPGTLDISLFASFVSIGTALSAIPAGYLADIVGRKPMLIFMPMFLTIGWFFTILNVNIFCLLFGRFLTGIGLGIGCVVCPMYLAEILSPKMRGRLVISYELLSTVGSASVYMLFLLMSWRWPAVIASSLAALFSLLVVLGVIESPRWLLRMQQNGNERYRKEALQSLAWLRDYDSSAAKAEMLKISQHLDAEEANVSHLAKLRMLFAKRRLRRPLLLTIGMIAFQQLSGINALASFSQQILADVGFLQKTWGSAILRLGGCIATLTASVLVDRVGRKRLLTISACINALANILLGLYFYFRGKNQLRFFLHPWIAFVMTLFSDIGFALGIGPVPMIFMSEVIPSSSRGLACGVATTCKWLFATIVSSSFLSLQSLLCSWGVFWLYTFFTALGVLFVISCVPETKGKTLEDIESLFS